MVCRSKGSGSRVSQAAIPFPPSRMLGLFPLTVLVLAALLVSPASAQIVGTPPAGTVLNVPGQVVVFDQDLVVPDGFTGDVLRIDADDVTVDGNGYSILFESGAQSVARIVYVNIVQGATVQNLHVDLSGGSPTEIWAGIYLLSSQDCIVENCVLEWEAFGPGIMVQGLYGPCAGNQIIGNHCWGSGIRMMYDCDGNLIQENDCSETRWGGISLAYGCDSNLVLDNTVQSAGDPAASGPAIGVFGSSAQPSLDNQIAGNDVSGALWGGISVVTSPRTRVHDNVYVGSKIAIAVGGMHDEVIGPPDPSDPNRYITDVDFSAWPLPDGGSAIFLGAWGGCTGMTVTGVKVHPDSAPHGTGGLIWLTDSSNCTVTNCTLALNPSAERSPSPAVRAIGYTAGASRGNQIINNDCRGSSISLQYDCDQHLIQANDCSGTPWGGIGLAYGCDNNLVLGNVVANSGDSGGVAAVGLFGTSAQPILDNEIAGNDVSGAPWAGISIFAGLRTRVHDNVYVGSKIPIAVGGMHDEVIGPPDPADPDRYITDVDFSAWPLPDGGSAIYLGAWGGCTGMTVTGVKVHPDSAPHGTGGLIWLTDSSNCTVTKCTLALNPSAERSPSPGIRVIGYTAEASRGNQIINNDCLGSGIRLQYDCDQHLIQGNDCSDAGISIAYGCDGNQVVANAVRNAPSVGIGILSGGDNELCGNDITGALTGLRLQGSSTTLVYHNNIFSNSLNAYSDTAIELSYNGEGNYWGHSCDEGTGELFTPGVDSNALDVVDSHAYETYDGWLHGDVPGCDSTPPVITIHSPTASGYPFGSPILFSFEATDESGIESLTATVDDMPVSSGDTRSDLALGEHVLTVTAADPHGNSATEAVTFQVVNSAGTVTAGGWIELANKKATSGFTAQYTEGDPAPTGSVEYTDHDLKMNVKSSALTALGVSGNQAWISGVCTVDGEPGHAFLVHVIDDSQDGKTDFYAITLDTGYSAGGTLGGGNVTVHQ